MNIKDKALHFLDLVIKGEIDKAYDLYIADEGKHHNVHFPSGFEALKKAMKHNHKLYPNKLFEVKLCVAEVNKVAVLAKMGFEDRLFSINYFFTFEEGKIIEMWDNIQEITNITINQDGPF